MVTENGNYTNYYWIRWKNLKTTSKAGKSGNLENWKWFKR